MDMVSRIELREITGDAGVDLFQTPLHLALGEVPVPRVDRLELAAVDGHARVAEKIEAPAQQNERAADFADRPTVVLAEIRKSLEVRHQAAGQPHQPAITLALQLQASARLHPIEVSVDVNLQLRRRMVGRPTRCEGLNAVEAELDQIQPIDKDINRPHRIVLAHIVIQQRGKKRALPAIHTLDEAPHPILPQIARESYRENQINRSVFTQSGSRTAPPPRRRRGSITPNSSHAGRPPSGLLNANNSHQAARLVRSPANAALPVRVASDIVSKNSDCRT